MYVYIWCCMHVDSCRFACCSPPPSASLARWRRVGIDIAIDAFWRVGRRACACFHLIHPSCPVYPSLSPLDKPTIGSAPRRPPNSSHPRYARPVPSIIISTHIAHLTTPLCFPSVLSLSINPHQPLRTPQQLTHRTAPRRLTPTWPWPRSPPSDGASNAG